jgi:hypothetical protein
MSNSIDLNLGGDNSISNLTFHWIAIFKDGSKIEQFENGKENLFLQVKSRFDDLVYFNLTDRKGHLFTVDLIKGLIGYNDLLLAYRDEYLHDKKNIRLIYFRRHKIEFGEADLKEKFHSITYHLGYQYIDKLGNNRQIVLKIDSEGTWILGE